MTATSGPTPHQATGGVPVRGIPFHCPYCGDEDLRPSEEGHGAWECHSCLRVFSLKMLGMVARPTVTEVPS